MKQDVTTLQIPEPASRHLKFQGDSQTFTLTLSEARRGKAWLRTNIGYAGAARDEIIAEVDADRPPLGRDWFDIPMIPTDNRVFQVTVPLCEVGHFEGKCFFLEADSTKPVWPRGDNVILNVEPADTCGANIVYNAFVRQFGPNKSGGSSLPSDQRDAMQVLDKKGYAVIPPSGTFRDVIRELDFIFGELGCRILQLLPVHPTPTTYARMGRFGSPYASLSFTAVDPALAEFDPRATPLEQFMELVDAVHRHRAKIIIDIAINHTGWAASLHESHPEWLVRDTEGRIEVPGAWGVRWEDLTMLDYSRKELWQYMVDVFLTWCRRGVDGFRCDAGYMIPVAAWKYIVAAIRKQYPETIFFLEGLGGKISVTRDLLNVGNFNWAYSELFQNYDREQIERYLPESIDISEGDGITVHFAETHDNNRLASRSRVFARMRTALCALFSPNGAFGFANGVEWFATEKIDVHDSPSLNWGAEQNQVNEIRRLSTILKIHPAFYGDVVLKFVQKNGGSHVALVRHHKPSGKRLLILVNFDDERPAQASWSPEQAGMQGPSYTDLIAEKEITAVKSGELQAYSLQPGEVLCLSEDPDDAAAVHMQEANPDDIPDRIQLQRLRAKAMAVWTYYNGTCDLGGFDADRAAQELERDPIGFCRNLNPYSRESKVVLWQWPRDRKREVMIPPGHFLLVLSEIPFRAKIMDNRDRCLAQENSLVTSDGRHAALFSPLRTPASPANYSLNLSLYAPDQCVHLNAPILYLSEPSGAFVQTAFHRTEVLNRPLFHLSTNGCGAMSRINVRWGELQSKYDALLAGNLEMTFPDDRHIMLARCRAWLVYQGFSQQLCVDCLDAFHFSYDACAHWRFHAPAGQGEHVTLYLSARMTPGENAVQLRFFRDAAQNTDGQLPDGERVQLIVRPDIEDRNFHHTTKAYLGPESLWNKSIAVKQNGFLFSPHPERCLNIVMSTGTYVHEPEWHYMVHRPLEAERGLDPHSDLFSPGYFYADLAGGDTAELAAQIHTKGKKRANIPSGAGCRLKKIFEGEKFQTPRQALASALDHYIVKREEHLSVIAGYPWFLDWGRDSLIVTRGLIAAGKISAARAVLSLFGRFEKSGTIPNMIRGQDAGNRDTADAPLWFCKTCADVVHAEGNKDFLDLPCGGRSIAQILESIANHIMSGTPNGIRMDPESCLIFSPAHFTWMDTNFPAGTPRQGYPVEIQALWFAALSFFASIDLSGNQKKWLAYADKVKASIMKFFWLDQLGYLSDCLHADIGDPARSGEPDDALRPNQLFALTLDAITDRTTGQRIVESCEELLVPGALRSLSDRPVKRPLRIVHDGRLLNDPLDPYQGTYQGDEDTQRKPAYHNGTAWAWLLPTFCEAWVKAFGDRGTRTAQAWLSSGIQLMNQGCVGHVPEILDGDAPHQQRGCDAQAWSVSELLRVWLQLDAPSKRY
jgi:starch synthase (maltosyl-transferring)